MSTKVAAGLAVLLWAASAAAAEPPVEPRPGPVSAAAPAETATHPALLWKPEWPRFRTIEYVASGAFLAAGIGALFLQPSPGQWSQRNAFDESARDLFRIRDKGDRATTRALSDVILFGMLAYPFVVDVGAVAGGAHRNSDVAWQLAMMNVEALTFTIGLQTFVSALASRERPYGRTCGTDDGPPDGFCDGKRRYLSFYGGHATTVWTVAGLTCAHHQHLPLYGGGWPDKLACAAAMTTALAAATFRVTSDEHHATDTLLGSAIGFFAGYGLPNLLHYRWPGAKKRASMMLGGGPAPIGLSLMGALD